MKLNNFWAVVLLSICVFIVVFVVFMGAGEASGSCLRCVEPVPQVKERESDRGAAERMDAYPGPMPSLAPTPHPYPGHEWADDCYPVYDADGGYVWECDFR